VRFLARLLVGPAGLWIVGGLAAFYVASVGVSYFKGQSDGKAIERAGSVAAVIREDLRQDDANASALVAANAHVRRLLADNKKLAGEIGDLREQAAVDPNASRPALGVDSVRRLNRIR